MKSDYFTTLFGLYTSLEDDIPPTLIDLIFPLFPISDHSAKLHEQFYNEMRNTILSSESSQDPF